MCFCPKVIIILFSLQKKLRIRIECAFRMLVNRWGILCLALPSQFSLNWALLLVMTLCRLHNYCINERIKHKKKGSLFNQGTFNIAPHLATDNAEIISHGGVSMERLNDRYLPTYVRQLPEQLLHGRQHHDDTERKDRRRVERAARTAAEDGLLP
jgi:hypothetical protein